MDEPSPAEPAIASITANPLVAVGRKVKSVLGTHQRPSVRIIRESSSIGARGIAEKLVPQRSPNSKPRGPGNTTKSYKNDESVEGEYDADEVDLLDVVDPEVSTLSTLTNVQNSLFIPSLGKLLNRRATYTLSNRYQEASTIDKLKGSLNQLSSSAGEDHGNGNESRLVKLREMRVFRRTSAASSALGDLQYAVLPQGETLQGWPRVDKEDLDDLVRHMLHSRRARFKRSMRGFWQYVRRPLGLFVTVYATLVTLFGAAWVLFLIGWISLGSKQDYIINVVDNVLVALFAIIGDGLAPFRAVDTYHMTYIAHYHRKTTKKRKKLGLPELMDHNDLPDQRKEDSQSAQADLESLVARKIPHVLARRVAPRIPKLLARRIVDRYGSSDSTCEYSVLTEEEQEKLKYHERKFSKSHTFYKPHETETHYAFPFKLLIAVVVLLDCHSALQITLGACTWGIPYEHRPFALTTVVLCFSITCNILGGVLISMGDKRTRKKDVIERMMKQELTADAIWQIQSRRLKAAEERGEVDESVRKRLDAQREEEESEDIRKAWKGVPKLPKTLLGKGEDHRQPSLPQDARRSSSSVASPSDSSKSRFGKSKGSVSLPPLQENLPTPPLPTRPKPAHRKREESNNLGTGQKILKLIRKADLDKS